MPPAKREAQTGDDMGINEKVKKQLKFITKCDKKICVLWIAVVIANIKSIFSDFGTD